MKKQHVVFGFLSLLLFLNVCSEGQTKGEGQGGNTTPQQAAPPSARNRKSSKKLTNRDIIDMADLKLSDDVIIDKIHSTEATDFDTSVVGLKMLKANNVSDAVVRAMINPRRTIAVASDPVTPETTAVPSPSQHPKLDAKANEAVIALKKVQARAEIGADYRDYSSALADAYFSVKIFLESGQADTVPEFSKALRDSVTWYKTAEDVAKAMRSSNPAEQEGSFLCEYDNGPALCKSHPELVESHTAKDGTQFRAIVMFPLKQSLKRAGEELEKADKSLNSDQ